MGDYITDSIKRKAMDVPYLRELLLSDSIYLASNITFENLAPLSTDMGKPGPEANGGIPFQEYRKRQEQHRRSEIAALLDTPEFIGRAEEIYQYDHFICDCSGSICEVVDPFDHRKIYLYHFLNLDQKFLQKHLLFLRQFCRLFVCLYQEYVQAP